VIPLGQLVVEGPQALVPLGLLGRRVIGRHPLGSAALEGAPGPSPVGVSDVRGEYPTAYTGTLCRWQTRGSLPPDAGPAHRGGGGGEVLRPDQGTTRNGHRP
jgi:hypothetical protein